MIRHVTPVTDIIMVCQDVEDLSEQEVAVAFLYLKKYYPQDRFTFLPAMREHCCTEHKHVHNFFRVAK